MKQDGQIQPMQVPSALEVIRAAVADYVTPKVERVKLDDQGVALCYSEPVGLLSVVYAAIFFTLQDAVAVLSNSNHVPTESIMQFDLKSFIIRSIVQWVLVIGGGWFAAVGISTGTVEEIVGAVVALIIGIVSQLLHKVALLKTTPPKVQQ